jgi:putative N6-adenine-specific DNA methylase
MNQIRRYFATVAPGLEPIAAQELVALGATEVLPVFGGVSFAGDKTLLYRVNLWGRTIYRILVPLKEFACTNGEQLYQAVQRLDWELYLTPAMTLAVDCTGSSGKLNHTHFSALQVKNAIIDQQRTLYNERSSVDTANPHVRVNLHLHQGKATLSLDSSGDSLHRRGYRPAVGVAPLKETLAAALLEFAQWHPGLPLLDPLCGSGTLPLEAGLKALNIAPGYFRKQFGFQSWLDFDPTAWQQLLNQALDGELTALPAPIYGSDQDFDTVQQAMANARLCGLEDKISFLHRELLEVEAPCDQGVFICNPPYGHRLGEEQELGALYKTLGDILKQRFKGWTAFILTGNRELAKQVGLRTAKRTAVYNGTLPCTLLKYELY